MIGNLKILLYLIMPCFLICLISCSILPSKSRPPSWEIYKEWPFSSREARRRQEATATRLDLPQEITVDIGRNIQMEFVLIPAGVFGMGTASPKQNKSKPYVGVWIAIASAWILVVLITIRFWVKWSKGSHRRVGLRVLLLLTIVVSIGVGGGVSAYQAQCELRNYKLSVYRKNLADEKFYDESPIHKVTISKPFYLGKYEVTQEQYLCIRKSPFASKKVYPKVPIIASALDCDAYCSQLFSIIKNADLPFSIDIKTIRLPTEAEWEYSCRGGSETAFYFGDSLIHQSKYSWGKGNPISNLHPGGLKLPNNFGLYDMSGNASEWCQDNEYSYLATPSIDPLYKNDSSEIRILRGGSVRTHPTCFRSASRGSLIASHVYFTEGFRAVIELDLPGQYALSGPTDPSAVCGPSDPSAKTDDEKTNP